MQCYELLLLINNIDCLFSPPLPLHAEDGGGPRNMVNGLSARAFFFGKALIVSKKRKVYMPASVARGDRCTLPDHVMRLSMFNMGMPGYLPGVSRLIKR